MIIDAVGLRLAENADVHSEMLKFTNKIPKFTNHNTKKAAATSIE